MDSQASPRMLCSTRPLQSPLCLQQGTPHSRCSITWKHAAHLSKWGPDLILQHKQKSTNSGLMVWASGSIYHSLSTRNLPCITARLHCLHLSNTWAIYIWQEYQICSNTLNFLGARVGFLSLFIYHCPSHSTTTIQNTSKWQEIYQEKTHIVSINKTTKHRKKQRRKTKHPYPLHIHCISIAYPLHIHPYISNLTTPPRSPSAFGLLRHLWRFLRPASVTAA